MARSQMGTRRNNSRGGAGRSGMVFLQRRNREKHVRQFDSARDAGGSTLPLHQWSRQRKTNTVANINLKELTMGESLLIARRRSGESQEKAAMAHGLTRNYYGRVERDCLETPHDISSPELGELTDSEACVIARRRSGMNQDECAKIIGITRAWLHQMETDKVPCSNLVEFWRNRA